MFIAEATIDLKDIKIFDKFFNISASKPFLARDGILHEQIKAGNIKILVESSQIDNSYIDEYILFENENNKNIFDMLLIRDVSSSKNNIKNIENKNFTSSIANRKGKNNNNKKGAKNNARKNK